jgi:hypothetical protein
LILGSSIAGILLSTGENSTVDTVGSAGTALVRPGGPNVSAAGTAQVELDPLSALWVDQAHRARFKTPSVSEYLPARPHVVPPANEAQAGVLVEEHGASPEARYLPNAPGQALTSLWILLFHGRCS